MNEPSDKQVKEFWEWCGVGYEYWLNEIRKICPSVDGIDCWEPPNIDLDNLVRFAVPKVEKTRELTVNLHRIHGGYYGCLIETHFGEVSHHVADSKDPALALFWALWQVMQEEKNGHKAEAGT